MLQRIWKYARLSWKNLAVPDVPSPPFLILFINSICNMKCEHCFYWQQLNQPDDLTVDEIVSLSKELGPIENLNLSGGEPFIRKEFSTICRQFVKHNGVKEIYVPTNGWYTDRTLDAVRQVLQERDLRLLGIELSLDGMPEFHDEFRKAPGSFQGASVINCWCPVPNSPTCYSLDRHLNATVLSSTGPTHREETTLSQSHVFLPRKRRVHTHLPLRILPNHGRKTASLPVRGVRTDVLDDKGHALLPSPAPKNNVRHGRHTPRRGCQSVGDRPDRTAGLEYRRPLARAGRFGVSSI